MACISQSNSLRRREIPTIRMYGISMVEPKVFHRKRMVVLTPQNKDICVFEDEIKSTHYVYLAEIMGAQAIWTIPHGLLAKFHTEEGQQLSYSVDYLTNNLGK